MLPKHWEYFRLEFKKTYKLNQQIIAVYAIKTGCELAQDTRTLTPELKQAHLMIIILKISMR